MSFIAPGWLVLLIPVGVLAVAYVALQFRRKKYVARFSNLELLASVAPKRPGWRRHLTFTLLLVSLIILSVGVAQPAGTVRVPRDRATVMLALDISQSMQAEDVSDAPNRIEASKKAAKEFVDIIPSRINVGLVKFAGSASVVVPPTIDRDAVKVAIDGLTLQDSTAIGEAVYTCLDAISIFSKATTAKDDKPAPARIVLMSDGKSNKGRRVADAAKEAKTANIPVSTIAFGTDTGTVDVDGERIPVPADKTALRNLANQTGGDYYSAATTEQLRNVFKDIQKSVGYTNQKKDVSWRFLATGVLFLLAAAGCSMLWAGRLI